MVNLRGLLEMRQALPLSFSLDGRRLLVSSDVPGTHQLYEVSSRGGELEQLTNFPEAVSGRFLQDGRILLELDEGGNERTQLYILDDPPVPLVVDPRYIHGTPHTTGLLLAYVTNRRNGVDFDVVAHDLASGEERVFEPGGNCSVQAVSPDGRWIVVDRVGEAAGDNDLLLCDVASGQIVRATPHDEPAEYYAPVWLDGGDAFLLATNEGRDTFAIARYDVAKGTLDVVHESDWDLVCVGDDSGRSVLVVANEDGYARLELRDPETLALREEIALPGRGVVERPTFSHDGELLAFGFSTPVEPHDVYLYELSTRELRRLTTSAREVDPATLVQPEL